jgi:hypothetical protein
MTRSLAIIGGLILLLAFPALGGQRPLLPQPQQIEYGPGNLSLKGLAIRYARPANAQDRFTASLLATNSGLTIGSGKSRRHAILLNRTGDGADTPRDGETTGPASRESYTLSVSKVGVEIRAPSSAGLFYGVQTLLQLIDPETGTIPVVEIHDWPALAYRGFMMDFSEGQRLKVSEIERQLDLLARFKANQYYFYSEMAIAWKGYETVNNYPGARFTFDEVRQVIDYARQRHIDVVPCIELYGHLHQLFRSEKFAGLGLPRYGDEVDPRNPGALPLIDDIFDQAISLFDSPWCHVGFDEPWSLGKIGMTPGKDPFATFVEYLQHLADRAQQRGKRIVYWADVENPSSTLRTHPELISKLPASAISGPWQYDFLSNYDRFVQPLADAGLPTVVAPGIFNWNEVFPDYHHTFANINGMVATGKKFKTLGLINTGWTDCGQTLYRQSLPGIAFGAIAGWQSEPVNTNTFFQNYTAITCPPAEAPEVAAALEQLTEAEEMFETILNDPTQHGFWKNPLEPSFLARMEKRQDDCRKARLLAESAVEHIATARRAAPDDPTLNSLMMAARLFDYLGMKCLYVVEWNDYFRQLQKKPDETLMHLYMGVQMVQQGNGMLADLTDAITSLREPYREAWLDESTPYRLDAALVRWDAESRFWRDTWSRVNHLLGSRKKDEPFPSIDVLRAKPAN